jgi:exo-poly-alpha-galacturonosidase
MIRENILLRLGGSLLAAVLLTGPVAASAPAGPGKPQQVRALPQTITDSTVTLVWEKPAASAAVREYVVYNGKLPVATTTRTNARVGRLRPGDNYTFTVRARNATGQLGPTTPAVRVRTAAVSQLVNIISYGAVPDSTRLNTTAIQQAIDACPAGGTVYIPAGTFRSGALFLKSNMTLYLAKGATLKGSADSRDYLPCIRTRFEGWELDTYASLLTAGKLDNRGGFAVENLAIRGQGTISGGGDVLGKAMTAAKGFRTRGRLFCLMNCRNVDIQGLTIEESPSWTIHYIYSQQVACHDLTIRSTVFNGDGIDPDSSLDSYIFNCWFDTSDDCIAVKSGKNPEGYAIGRPTEGVYVSYCDFREGHGISIGSEISGSIRRVVVRDCQAGNLLYGMQIKGTKERGGVVEDVLVRDCALRRITVFTALNYNNDGQAAPVQPTFRNLRFENIDMRAAKPKDPIVLQGFPDPAHYTRQVLLRNVTLPDDANVQVRRCDQVRFINVRTASGAKPTYQITESTHIEQ